MSKKVGIILAIVVIILALGVWWMTSTAPKTEAPAVAPQGAEAPPPPAAVNLESDATADISAGLNQIDIGDVESDFGSVDEDTKGL